MVFDVDVTQVGQSVCNIRDYEWPSHGGTQSHTLIKACQIMEES